MHCFSRLETVSRTRSGRGLVRSIWKGTFGVAGLVSSGATGNNVDLKSPLEATLQRLQQHGLQTIGSNGVAELFGRTPHSELNPDEVVALGAAVQADILVTGNRELLGEYFFRDVRLNPEISPDQFKPAAFN